MPDPDRLAQSVHDNAFGTVARLANAPFGLANALLKLVGAPSGYKPESVESLFHHPAMRRLRAAEAGPQDHNTAAGQILGAGLTGAGVAGLAGRLTAAAAPKASGLVSRLVGDPYRVDPGNALRAEVLGSLGSEAGASAGRASGLPGAEALGAIGGSAAAIPHAAKVGFTQRRPELEAAYRAELTGPIETRQFWHGTPYPEPYPEFDLSKMLSGEGSTMEGPGIYMSESRPTARFYEYNHYGTPDPSTGGITPQTNLLQGWVDVPKNQTLDLDIPMNQQPKRIQKALLGDDPNTPYGSMTGKEFVRQVVPDMAANAGKSELDVLRDAGVRVSQYANAKTRKGPIEKRVFNMVLHDPSIADIHSAETSRWSKRRRTSTTNSWAYEHEGRQPLVAAVEKRVSDLDDAQKAGLRDIAENINVGDVRYVDMTDYAQPIGDFLKGWRLTKFREPNTTGYGKTFSKDLLNDLHDISVRSPHESVATALGSYERTQALRDIMTEGQLKDMRDLVDIQLSDPDMSVSEILEGINTDTWGTDEYLASLRKKGLKVMGLGEPDFYPVHGSGRGSLHRAPAVVRKIAEGPPQTQKTGILDSLAMLLKGG